MRHISCQIALLKIIIIAMAGVVVTASTLAAELPSREQVLSDMVLANTYFTNKYPTPGCSTCLSGKRPSNIWTRGTYFNGLLALYRINNDPRIYDYAVGWGNFHSWGLRNGDATANADDQCCGQAYIELYQLDPTQTNRLTHIANNVNNWMSTNAPQRWWWIDAIHMSMPVFAKLSALNSNTIPALATNYTYSDKIYSYFHYAKSVNGYSNGLYNATDHLWWRDTNFLSGYTASDGTTQKCYWSRGNGWVFAALTRTLDVLPTNDVHFSEYLQTFQEMAAKLITVQRSDGFWNVNLAYTNDFPGPETSGTAMFTYGLAWGLNHGYLLGGDYYSAAVNGWNAMAIGALHHTTGTNNGFLGYVQDTGDRPSSSQPVTYDKIPLFDDYGLGAFLSAGSEIYRLNVPPVAGTNTYIRGSNTTLKISVTNLLANATDANADPISLVAINPSTNGVTPTFDSTYIYYTNANNVDDRFTYVISDGYAGNVSTGSVQVLITQATANKFVSVQFDIPGPNSNTITLAGIPGYQYSIQFATNLSTSPWFPLLTTNAGSNGLWTVVDPTAADRQRYYRSLAQ